MSLLMRRRRYASQKGKEDFAPSLLFRPNFAHNGWTLGAVLLWMFTASGDAAQQAGDGPGSGCMSIRGGGAAAAAAAGDEAMMDVGATLQLVDRVLGVSEPQSPVDVHVASGKSHAIDILRACLRPPKLRLTAQAAVQGGGGGGGGLRQKQENMNNKHFAYFQTMANGGLTERLFRSERSCFHGGSPSSLAKATPGLKGAVKLLNLHAELLSVRGCCACVCGCACVSFD